jgi:ribonuclease HI
MELMSVCVALEMLKNEGCQVTIFSDSKYVVDSVEKKWIDGWIRRGWENVKNPDLWIRYLSVASKHHVRFQWIRGHNGHAMNERCDELAVAASKGSGLKADSWYELNRDKESLF